VADGVCVGDVVGATTARAEWAAGPGGHRRARRRPSGPSWPCGVVRYAMLVLLLTCGGILFQIKGVSSVSIGCICM
jgi:hypothetical protein